MNKKSMLNMVRRVISENMDSFPDLKKWWTYKPKEIMKSIYWQNHQLPPSDESKYEKSWNNIKSKLQQKFPPPSDPGIKIAEGPAKSPLVWIKDEKENGWYAKGFGPSFSLANVKESTPIRPSFGIPVYELKIKKDGRTYKKSNAKSLDEVNKIFKILTGQHIVFEESEYNGSTLKEIDFANDDKKNPLYVEYVSDRKDEEPFMMGSKKYQFVNAKYPDGRMDLGVYAYQGDVVYGYNAWRKMNNLKNEEIKLKTGMELPVERDINVNLDDYIDMKESVFDNIDDINLERIDKSINAPFVKTSVMTLGSKGRESIVIKLSLDDRNSWINNIFQNSRYMTFMIHNDAGSMKFLSGHRFEPRFRKTRVNSIGDAVNKINKYIGIVA